MTLRQRAAAAFAGALARALLLFYPVDFRLDVGPALVADVRRRALDQLAQHGLMGLVAWWLRTGASLAGNAVAEWRDRGRSAARDPWQAGPLHLRHAARRLTRAPAFSLVVVATLALGIGGTTAVFGAVRAVLLRPLPYDDPGALVRLYNRHTHEPDGRQLATAPHFLHYRAHARSFESLAAAYTSAESGADVLLDGQTERIRTLRVSPDYFRVLRQRPLHGRSFLPEEERGQAVAMVSERLWRRLDPEARRPGGTLELDGVVHTLVGVVPGSFQDPLVEDAQVWVPEDLHGGDAQRPDNNFLTVVGRLAPGAGFERTREEMARLDGELAAIYPEAAAFTRFVLVPLHEDRVGEGRPALFLLLGAVGLVLLIACVNVANLQMVRAVGRARDVALRAALGAGRARIAGENLLESLLLSGLGGLAGVGVALGGVEALRALGRHTLPRAEEIAVDVPVLAFAAAVSVAAGIAFGLAPAVRSSRSAPASALHASSAGSGDPPWTGRLRGALVAGQVALAFLLLVGAWALAASALRLARVDLGIRTDRVLTFELNLPPSRYDQVARSAFHEALVARLAALPGVESAAAASWLPAGGSAYAWGTFAVTGPRAGTEEGRMGADQRFVAGGYFDLLGIPVLEGRALDPRPGEDQPPAVLLGRTAAERLFPGTSAVGQRVRIASVERTVVGVVEDVASSERGDRGHLVYHAQAQNAGRNWTMSYLVRVRGGVAGALAEVRGAVAATDLHLVVHRPRMLDEALRQGRDRQRFVLLVTATFAALALTLAGLGLYGVLAHLVARRRREIGIRMALGAGGTRVLAMVARQGLALTLLGLALGVPGSLVLGRILASFVFHTEPTEAGVLAGAATTLLLVAVLATAIPATRALRVPPRSTLAEG